MSQGDFAGGVDGVTRLEVVGAVEHHVGIGHQGRQRLRIGALHASIDVHVGIDRRDRCPRRVGLGRTHVGQPVRDLALQVGEIDLVGVDQRDAADAGAAEVQRHRRPQAAGTDHQRTRAQQALLALDADLVEQHVA